MRTKTKKILAAVMVSTMLVSSVGASSVCAGSSSSGSLKGITCTSSLAYTKNSSGTQNGVVATTTFPATGSITAKATVYYKDVGGNKKWRESSKNSNTSGGVSATASAEGYGTVYGGIGTHTVAYDGDTWSSNTTIGSTN